MKASHLCMRGGCCGCNSEDARLGARRCILRVPVVRGPNAACRPSRLVRGLHAARRIAITVVAAPALERVGLALEGVALVAVLGDRSRRHHLAQLTIAERAFHGAACCRSWPQDAECCSRVQWTVGIPTRADERDSLRWDSRTFLRLFGSQVTSQVMMSGLKGLSCARDILETLSKLVHVRHN